MIPPLPTEILHHIIKLSLPVVSFRTYRERYDLLLAYSLVDSTWRVLSQQELQQHLYFRQGMSPPSFKLPARHNRRMYLGGKRPAVGQPVPDAELSNYSHLLRSGIKHLTIIYSTMTVEDLMLCDELETLHLHQSLFGREFPPLPLRPLSYPSLPIFASLTTLSFVGASLKPDTFPQWTEWFTPTTLPALQHLTFGLHQYADQDYHANDNFLEAFGALAPQLHSLALVGYDLGMLDHTLPLSSLTRLRRFTLYAKGLESSNALRAALWHIPTALERVRVGFDGPVFPGEIGFRVAYGAEEDWESLMLNSIVEVLTERRPSLRGSAVLELECKNGARPNRRAGMRLMLARGEMGSRGGRLVRRAGWVREAGEADWQRFCNPW